MNQDFSVRPFVAGSVFGLRSFRVDHDGNLAAATRAEAVWRPGENLAACLKASPFTGLAGIHDVASANCSCGFYAFFDGSNDYGGWATVTGIIEGYGIVTVGSRGFRAAKARIIALVWPGEQWDGFDRSAALYPDIPVYSDLVEALAAHPLTKPEDVGITPREYPSHTPRFAQGGWLRGVHNLGNPGVTGMHVHVALNATAFQQALSKVSQAMKQSDAALAKLKTLAEESSQNPVERKRAAAQAAADARRSAGLRNIGGIDRRRRRP